MKGIIETKNDAVDAYVRLKEAVKNDTKNDTYVPLNFRMALDIIYDMINNINTEMLVDNADVNAVIASIMMIRHMCWYIEMEMFGNEDTNKAEKST